jgi:hypothetical protein
LLADYALMGRGFAHIGVGPAYVGEFVLALGLAAVGWAMFRARLQVSRSSLVAVLLLFMGLGLLRTVPYIPTYGTNALRDATLWGYAVFALMLFVLLDREWVLRLFKAYGFFAIAFLIGAPIAYAIFDQTASLTAPGSFVYSSYLIPNAPGTNIPIIFFKSQDMAVQTAGVVAFLVLGTPLLRTLQGFLWRVGAAIPAAWLVYVTGTVTRGGLMAVAAMATIAGGFSLLAGKTRNWVPVLCGTALVAILVSANFSLVLPLPSPASPTSGPTASASAAQASPTPRPTPPPSPTPLPPWAQSRPATTTQWWENICSIFADCGNSQLTGTKAFRLAWWGDIVNYTIKGPYFWDGKGFGINLANDDGFQGAPDGSVREPPNTHLAVLARMGVPGFLLWIILQLGFAVLLLRAFLAYKRARDPQMAAVAAWVVAFWTAMMVNTSFDPYLEGPQGGIWFWSLFGLGLVLIRLAPRRGSAAADPDDSPS